MCVCVCVCVCVCAHLIWRGLLGDLCVDEVVEVGGEGLVGEVCVLSQHVCCQVIVLGADELEEGLDI